MELFKVTLYLLFPLTRTTLQDKRFLKVDTVLRVVHQLALRLLIVHLTTMAHADLFGATQQRTRLTIS